MSTLPSFETYGNYSNKNYGAHALVFTDAGGNDFYFSYKTLVAFRKVGSPVVVRENAWGPTTGKYLNAIDGGNGKKTDRVNSVHFDALLRKAFPGLSKGVA